MRILLIALCILILLATSSDTKAASRQSLTLQTSSGKVLVERFILSGSNPRPAVLILSGSRGFGSTTYDDIGQTMNAAGLDAYLVHVLTPTDLNAIASADSARARIAYYAQKMPEWTATVRGVVSYLDAQPNHARGVGVLGVSLGAQIAAAASAGRTDIGALVLVDGGFPNDHSQPVRLPPLHLIWGSADRTFPLSIAQHLHKNTQSLRIPSSLDVYKGGAHDFFLKTGSAQAQAAHQSAARFLASQLLRQPER